MPVAPAKGDPKYLDYIINLGKSVLARGQINELRVFFDEITPSPTAGVIVAGTPETFYNGEQFPIRLTHMLACMRYLTTAAQPAVANQLDVSRMALRLQFHNQFYMNPIPLPLTAWGNKVVAAPEAFSSGNAHWDFIETAQPYVLAVRDTMVVRLQLRDAAAPSTPVPVTVTFHGVGMLSRRPFIFTGSVQLSTIDPVDMSTVDFRNDGSEPVVITDLTMTVGAELGANSPAGDINRVRLSIRQVGNGTQAAWFAGPVAAVPPAPFMQATLLGLSTGRAVVHQFPGLGLHWEPGEGITAEITSLVANNPNVLCLAFAGYIMVT